MNMDDFKLELKALQNKDMEDAKAAGFEDKDAWVRHIINAEKDEVAEAVQDLAKRYGVQDNVVAYYFDPTMFIRLSKLKASNKNMTM